MRWSIVYGEDGTARYYRNGREVSEEDYRRLSPSRFHEIITAGTVRTAVSKDSGWEYENDGRGRYIGQLGEASDPRSYARSRNELKEELRRRGWTWRDA